MLSDQGRAIIEATMPLVAERLPVITPNFYARMFAARPELMDGLFSRSNQASGIQQQALAGSIVAFASHLMTHPDSFPETVLSRIAHKHASLGIVPEQYPIVYQYLFEAIAEELSDVITDEIAGAWSEVYWLMAHALIKIEKGLYAQAANDKPFSPWVLTGKEPAGVGSMTFTFEPADETPVSPSSPGQFITIKVPMPDGIYQVRQYSLHSDTHAARRVFTTKLDVDGEVSPVLHHTVKVGDVLELSNPYGDVTLGDGNHPLVLASAGIGCTPTASILRSLVDSGSDREVLVLHADQGLENWALQKQMSADVEKLDSAQLQLWLERPEAGFNKGFMTLAGLDIPDDASVYLCGPLPFMKSIRSQALASGIPAERIHYEVFGPDLWLASA
ncbi:hemin transporter [Paeniglutamicibacter antarcticus]|uniref:nitric oxide dioxygenase n=1 Tax=Arthrobacter terrae TaxID=2935737 RepID=A0A931CSG0_9MICC|nr:globin domain-containing protein [Arthrobacter terrae]MBG0740079.1 hemin transporter [Arthrobacter terrae]